MQHRGVAQRLAALPGQRSIRPQDDKGVVAGVEGPRLVDGGRARRVEKRGVEEQLPRRSDICPGAEDGGATPEALDATSGLRGCYNIAAVAAY